MNASSGSRRRKPGIDRKRRIPEYAAEAELRNVREEPIPVIEDRERVPKIQGLLNECMTFLDDELSVITGSYEDLLSIDDVIEQELILFVTLNINKNTEPVRALGKMLLQNLQLVIGRRYESVDDRRRLNRPLFSVVMDEFAPFGYRNFAQIVQTARGTNTAFLFSMQSLPQLMQVGRGFKEDVTSAPNTTIILRTRDERPQLLIRASAQATVSRRSYSLTQQRLFVHEWYEKTGAAVEREDKEYRVTDLDVKSLPKGQMQILMTDDARGVLHSRLHVRAPEEIRVPCFEPELYPRFQHSRKSTQGANLRFKNTQLASQIHARRPRRAVKRNETLRPALLISNTPRYSGTRRRFHPEVTAPNLYERVLNNINPENKDFGAAWESASVRSSLN